MKEELMCCEKCGMTDNLQVHHIVYKSEITQVLCVDCHRKCHSNRGVGIRRKIRIFRPDVMEEEIQEEEKKNNTLELPFCLPSICFVLHIFQDEKDKVYKTTKEEKSKLFKKMNELEVSEKTFEVYANRKWGKTIHRYDMDIPILKRRIEKEGVYSWAKDDKKDKQPIPRVKYILNEVDK